MRRVIVTGAAGFIGFHLCRRLLREGFWVEGLDNLSSSSALLLKEARLSILKKDSAFSFHEIDICHKQKLRKFFEGPAKDAEYMFHLAAEVGVRDSIRFPARYVSTNVRGFLHVLEGCRTLSLDRIFYASSSSVYGSNEKVPFSEEDVVNSPLSVYAATKLANEHMASTYSSLYDIGLTGLRFFTVYGPYGRPDMALFKFVKAISEGREIDLYLQGKMRRDFTYIDDVIESLFRLMLRKEVNSLHEIYNVGRGKPSLLRDFLSLIEEKMNKKAVKKFLPRQKGDMLRTYADTNHLRLAIDYVPNISMDTGVSSFLDWYFSFYHSKS
ncbi:MAG: NAD-dependent epimerase/dehydratase family protein [Cytophagales bacterium]|nr:NAD-dependent epimerase/dehydratase family protein [Cytophagales bacterium]